MNQGAESTLAFLLALAELRLLEQSLLAEGRAASAASPPAPPARRPKEESLEPAEP